MAKQTSKQNSKQITKKTSAVKHNTKKQFFLIRWAKSSVNYFIAAYGELKKVTWPTRKELMKNTWIVTLLIGIFTAVIFCFDTVFSFLTSLLYGIS